MGEPRLLERAGQRLSRGLALLHGVHMRLGELDAGVLEPDRRGHQGAITHLGAADLSRGGAPHDGGLGVPGANLLEGQGVLQLRSGAEQQHELGARARASIHHIAPPACGGPGLLVDLHEAPSVRSQPGESLSRHSDRAP